MGLFNKFKEIFKKEDKKDIELYDKGLEKTRKEFVSNLSFLGHKYTKVNDEYFDELESILIKADIGVNTTYKFLDKLKKRVKEEKIEDAEVLREIIIDELFMIYVDGDSLTDKINIQKEGPTVILMVGVNGVGKTTTIGKLANIYHNQGHKVMLIGADTFRAGAVPQLEEWAKRTNSCFCGKENVDPSSVIYDGLEKALKENCDLILIDTAGRLQNKVNLMNELEKINKVIGKFIPGAPHETLLIIDATTGQNGISQAISFKEITNITGIVLTKLDGTAKGGIVLAIKEEVNLPVKFVGLGEGINDLKSFDIEEYGGPLSMLIQSNVKSKVVYEDAKVKEIARFKELFDYYQNLLTDVQRKYFEDYYFNNLSLQEIADSYDVSRNAISKTLKEIKEKLDYYESNLKLLGNNKKIRELLSEEDLKRIEEYI